MAQPGRMAVKGVWGVSQAFVYFVNFPVLVKFVDLLEMLWAVIARGFRDIG
jgi:hypothetical protein